MPNDWHLALGPWAHVALARLKLFAPQAYKTTKEWTQMGRHDLRSQGASIIAGLLYFWITSSVVALGVALGVGYIPETRARAHKFDYAGDYYANWDGQWYKDIARHGYFYKEGDFSSVAFFPAFPLCGRLLSRVSGLREEMALLVVANVLLAASFALFALYLRERFPDAPKDFHGYALVMMGILPTTFFFRMAYSESTFLVCEILSLYAMVRRWPLIVVSILVGLGTAARPVGIALVPALLLHIWDRSPTRLGFLLRSLLLVPLSCWGLAAYMGYQWWEFGDALAFAKTQANWVVRKPPSAWAKFVALATLEPLLTLYDPTAPGYWGNDTGALDFPFSLRAADPFFFVGALQLTIAGYLMRLGFEIRGAHGRFLDAHPVRDSRLRATPDQHGPVFDCCLARLHRARPDRRSATGAGFRGASRRERDSFGCRGRFFCPRAQDYLIDRDPSGWYSSGVDDGRELPVTRVIPSGPDD